MDFSPPTPLGTPLSQLVALLEAKYDGSFSTSQLTSNFFNDALPIDDAIQYKMTEIRSIDEFVSLQAEQNPFMDRWFEIEDLWQSWQFQESLPDRGFFREMLGMYMGMYGFWGWGLLFYVGFETWVKGLRVLKLEYAWLLIIYIFVLQDV